MYIAEAVFAGRSLIRTNFRVLSAQGKKPNSGRETPAPVDPYESRSEADFAVCLAMFSAGYEEGQIRAILMDPANGISEKYREKGHYGESYLTLTLRKARMHARGSGLRHRPGKILSRHRKQRKVL